MRRDLLYIFVDGVRCDDLFAEYKMECTESDDADGTEMRRWRSFVCGGALFLCSDFCMSCLYF